MAGKCTVLLWDNYRITGTVACFSNDKLKIISREEGDPQTPPATQLREVFSKLKRFHADAVILGGFLPEFYCFELNMPPVNNLTLKNMLLFELPSRIPVPMDGVTVFFRVVKRESSQNKVRVFVVRTQVWRKTLDILKEAGIAIDAFCHPFMAVELNEEMKEAAFPQLAPHLKLMPDEQGLAVLNRSDVELTEDSSVEVLAGYALSKAFYKDKAFLSDLPNHLRIHRFKHRRRLAIMLTLLTIVSAAVLVYLHWQDQSRRIEAYHRAIVKTDNRLQNQNIKIESINTVGVFAGKMVEASNLEPVLPLLEVLSNKLPQNTWVTSFSSGNNKATVTLFVSGDSTALSAALDDLNGWRVENQRQQQETDGSSNWHLTLGKK